MADAPKDLDGASSRRPALRPFSGLLPKGGEGALRPLGARRPAAAPFSVGSPSAEAPERRRLTPPAVAAHLGSAESAPAVYSTPSLLVAEPVPGQGESATPEASAIEADGQSYAEAFSPHVRVPEPAAEPIPPVVDSASAAEPVSELTAAETIRVDDVSVLDAEVSQAAVVIETPPGATADADCDAHAEWLIHPASSTPVHPEDVWPHDLAEDVEGMAFGFSSPSSLFETSADEESDWFDVGAAAADHRESAEHSFDAADRDDSLKVVFAEHVADMGSGSVEASVPGAEPASGEVSAEVADAPVQLLDDELSAFRLSPNERVHEPSPIPGLDALVSTFVAAGDAAEPSVVGHVDVANAPFLDPVQVESAASEVTTTPATIDAREGIGAPGTDADPASAVESSSTSEEPRGATPLVDVLAEGDASLQAFTANAAAHAHVLDTLEAVARRVRSGEIVPVTSASATPEAVLASVLASLLAPRT